MFVSSRFQTLAVVLFSVGWVSLATAATKPPLVEFECRWTDSPITVDGKSDEPAWQHAQVIDHFYLPWLRDKARVSLTATKAKLLWDRDYLYFFSEMEDTDLFADQKDDELVWTNDVFELFFKPSEQQPAYYEFQVNPAAAKLDMFLPSRGAGGYARFKRDLKFHWDVKVSLGGTLNKWQDKDTGWSVEGRIPWTDFLRTGGRPTPNDVWRFTLCRYDYSVGFEQPELSATAPLSQPNFHHYENYSPLRFIGPQAKQASKPWGIEQLPPLKSSRVAGSPEPPSPYRTKRVYPNLKLNFPIAVEKEPGSSRFLIIDQPYPYGPSRLIRTSDNPEENKFEELLKFEKLGYSLAFHPQFEKNGYVYLGHNRVTKDEKKSLIQRYTISRTAPYKFDPNSALTILEWPSDGHNGVAITFGLDGMMYVTSGDGTSDSDTDVAGQRLDTLLSKVLRIDVDRPTAERPYSIPPDNPFVNLKGARPETWCYGLRNPWRITTDKKTGQIWVGNNGQDLWEQAYLIQRGANYGWSVYEGSHVFYATRQLGPHPHTLPTVEHSHADARSLTGGVVYHGQRLPELRGAYIYGDHSTGKIWGVRHDGQKILWHRELVDTSMNITAFAIDSDGELLIVDHRGKDEGGLHTLEINPAKNDPSQFPRTLTASGLFASVRDYRVAPGVIPYSVNSPLWSDGAHKERHLAIPADAGDEKVRGPYIEVTGSRGWKFPDRTVLIKSFALDMEEGNPRSRRWVETRFLTKQDGEWFGYSYRWNDEQTEATLVENGGADQEFSIRTADGVRKQAWRFPSRTECMVCHSRAANFVLGLSTLQMNREHHYGDRTDNQIRVLENLGLLRINYAAEAAAGLRYDLKDKEPKLAAKEIEDRVRDYTLGKNAADFGQTSILVRTPDKMPKMVDPYDPQQPLDARARSYLHANCSHCHVKSGGGNAKMELEFNTAKGEVFLIDEKPLHHTFGITDARLVAPGAPERSVLLHRISIRDRGQMPQLATSIPDQAAIAMLREWIKTLPLEPATPASTSEAKTGTSAK